MKTYIVRDVTRALAPTGGFLRGFSCTLNPYIGCAFGDANGCPFCYVRALPVANSLPGPWGSWVIAKTNLPEVLARELAELERRGKLDEVTVFMSSATDPYQGLERRMRISQRALQRFVQLRPRRILLQTRSPMIERDVELLRELGSRVIASITVETDDDQVRRSLSPTSPSVERRLATASRLRDAGIFTQIAIAPMMPNGPRRFAALVDECADRVIVDTYFDGDGSGGRRSRALGIGDLYASLGYRDWFRSGAEADLLAALTARMGARRVLFSRQGFNAIQ